MQPAQPVAIERERVEEALFGETIAHLGELVVACHRGEVVEHFVHAAVLGVENGLHVLLRYRGCPGVGPAGHARSGFQGLFVAANPVHVEQAGHDLMDRIEGHPDLAARVQAVEELDRESAEVPAAKAGLAVGHPGDNGVGFRLDVLVSGGSVHVRTRREEVPRETAAHLAIRLLPPAQRRCAGRDAGIQPEGV